MNTLEPAHRIRVLHIVGGMSRGGIETWLVQFLRHANPARFQTDFIVHTTEPCDYDNEVRALGGRIFPCPGHARPWRYAKNFRRIVTENGPYDVVHSHVHFYSGYVLRLAQRLGVPVRIAHSHNESNPRDRSANPLRKIYLALTKHWIDRYATIGLGASGKASKTLFGPRWQENPTRRTLYCGIDMEPFDAVPDPLDRKKLGLAPDAFVVGHVGRFVAEKNHTFLLEITRRLAEIEPRTRLLLVGEGPLRRRTEQQASRLGLSENVIFAGVRSDVPRLLLAAVDVFVMPSIHEGLPLASLEAQTARVPCVLADSITREADVIPQLVKRLSLSEPAAVWAKAVLDIHAEPLPFTRQEALAVMEASPFNIRASTAKLERLYTSATATAETSYAL